MVATGPDLSAPYARLAAVGLVSRSCDGRFLLLRRVPEGGWGPPGGRLEREESLEEALVREVGEETALNVEVAGRCYAYEGVHKGERLLAVSFACRTREADPVAPALSATEADDWCWVDPGEWLKLAEQGVTPWTKDDIVRATSLARCLWQVMDNAGGPDSRRSG